MVPVKDSGYITHFPDFCNNFAAFAQTRKKEPPHIRAALQLTKPKILFQYHPQGSQRNTDNESGHGAVNTNPLKILTYLVLNQ